MGAVFFKVQPIILDPFIGTLIYSIGLGFYGIAYLLWLVECVMSKDRKKPDAWYAFAGIKTQLISCAVIGLIATVFGISAIFFPILVIPTYWLFTVSNLFWLLGEYQKMKCPPEDDPSYQAIKQRMYVRYAGAVCIIGLLTAAVTTVALFFPPFLWVSLVLTPYLGGVVLKAWMDVYVFTPPETTEEGASPKKSTYGEPALQPDTSGNCTAPENKLKFNEILLTSKKSAVHQSSQTDPNSTASL